MAPKIRGLFHQLRRLKTARATLSGALVDATRNQEWFDIGSVQNAQDCFNGFLGFAVQEAGKSVFKQKIH